MAHKNLYLSQLTGDATYTQIVFNKVWGKVEAYQAAHPEKKCL
jgi:LL-diaminopimelate aminotransferase